MNDWEHVADLSIRCSSCERDHDAMGLVVWTWFVGGAVVGQLLLLVPLTSWGWAARGPGVESAVAKAVSETLKICLEIETTTTTTTTFFIWLTGPPFQAWWIWFALVLCGGILTGCCCLGLPVLWWWQHRPSGDSDTAEKSDSSPVSPQLALPDIARNQLAELRVRHHALRSNRLAAV